MFCVKCGKEIIEGASFCVGCGAPVTPVVSVQNEPVAEEPSVVEASANATTAASKNAAPVIKEVPVTASFGQYAPPNAVVESLIKACSSNAFLILCIFMSVAVGATVLMFSFNIINILFLVGLWMLRSAATSSNASGFGSPLNMIKILNLINVVLNWVSVAIITLFAVIVCLLGMFMPPLEEIFAETDIADMFNGLNEGLALYGFDVTFDEFQDGFYAVADFLASGGLILIGVIIFIIAIFLALFNIFCYHAIYRCSKSVAKSYLTGEKQFEKVTATANWLLVLGIFSGISALATLSTYGIISCVVSATTAVVMFIASHLLKKYFA